jgi:hypothetical protein
MNRVLLLIVGASYVLTALAMLLAPQWFFDTIGTFPPYNRHYTGDLGALTLPIGIALLWATRDPAAARGAVLIGVLASALHLLNHVYDAAIGTVPSRGWSDVPAIALALVLIIPPSWQLLRPETRRQMPVPGRA